MVCRYGGEEFALILRDTPLTGATALAERLREAVASIELKSGQERVRVSASFGIACSEQFESTARLSSDALMQAADQALYSAKEGGRNRVGWSSSSR